MPTNPQPGLKLSDEERLRRKLARLRSAVLVLSALDQSRRLQEEERLGLIGGG